MMRRVLLTTAIAVFTAIISMGSWGLFAGCARGEGGIQAHMDYFAGLGDRSTGSPGSEAAADYILNAFNRTGLKEVGAQEFLHPVPVPASASLQSDGSSIEVFPWGPNLVYLPVTPPEGLAGPVIYVGDGEPGRFDGLPVRGSIVLMDMASRTNWLNAAMFGASALVYIGDEHSIRGDFQEKDTPSPTAFPRFWAPPSQGEKLRRLAFQPGGNTGEPPRTATLHASARWRNKLVRNCYALIPGSSERLKEQLVVIEAFYDASSHILGSAPGTDEATSIAMLLTLAETLSKSPPERSVLLAATVGNGQALAGMRQFMWAVTEKAKSMKGQQQRLDLRKTEVDHVAELLGSGRDIFAIGDPKDRALLWDLVSRRAKDTADRLTRANQYRRAIPHRGGPAGAPSGVPGDTAGGADGPEDPRVYRALSWRNGMDGLTPQERRLTLKLLEGVGRDLKTEHKELKLRRNAIASSVKLGALMGRHKPVLFLSLYLSGNGPGVGLVDLGETYPLREQVRRQVRSSRLDEYLNRVAVEVAREMDLPNLIRSTSPHFRTEGEDGVSAPQGVSTSRIRCLACDVVFLAGCSAASLSTLDDDRSLWSTPYDTPDRLDRAAIDRLARFLPPVLGKFCSQPALHEACETGIGGGWAGFEGQAMFLRQGELFADQPAPGTVISVMQGNSIFRTMVNLDGSFFIPGVANNRVAFENLVVEPYGIDPVTGRIAWTADKALTNKENYRIKVKGRMASTSLTMFHCVQTDVVGAIQPQRMGYLSRVEVLDAVTDARPIHYWFSRLDGRDAMSLSVFLEPGARFKLVLSETMLQKEFLLLGGSPRDPSPRDPSPRDTSPRDTMGKGFAAGDPPSVPFVPFQVARDMRSLLGQRLDALHRHGIIDRYLETLYETAAADLDGAEEALQHSRYGQFWEKSFAAWSRLVVVGGQVGKTQRDVLMGVMFFIALFVPFAYVMERYLFSFRNIYRQIAAFFLILVLTILVIRGLHPAFQLTYSPTVVIIAFFIVGLSLVVSGIIFMRFEREMARVRESAAGGPGAGGGGAAMQTGKWQAFGAGFTIGASNLNRRKLRTALTCATLVILTFTVMSFTNVKSLHTTTDTRIADTAPYRGILLRHPLWRPLTDVLLEDMRLMFPESEASVWTRGWVVPPPGSGAGRLSVRVYAAGPNGIPKRSASAEGVLGVGTDPPGRFGAAVVRGRWFLRGERDAVLLPVSMAGRLGLDIEKDAGTSVRIWGDTFRVAGFFDGATLEALKDLDGNPLTPAYLEVDQAVELTEAEVEAMQSGEEVLPAMERFRYAGADATVIVPLQACLAHGGELKAISIMPAGTRPPPRETAASLSSRLAYPLFVGETEDSEMAGRTGNGINGSAAAGTWYHSAGTSLRYQGVANLLVPILIVVFICLNTMIGHVQERRREIAVYTSVGLAPTHVGFLFIVEAMSLAVISTVIGYILAQLSAKYLGSTAFFSQLTFNYSSLAGVACMVLVFSVVFAAALYPARMAARIAMPDVNRTWSLPAPEGDTITLNLPFLLKEEEEGGIMGYLAEFFTTHEDTSHGRFTSDETLLDAENPVEDSRRMPAPTCLFLRTNVWLTPFDFGIKQRVRLRCCPSQEAGYLEIGIMMIRLSGERTAWVRANHNFIKELRKRMLHWRFLRREEKVRYTAHAPGVPIRPVEEVGADDGPAGGTGKREQREEDTR